MHVMQTLLIFKERKLEQMMNDLRKKILEATSPEEETALQKSYLELKKQSLRIRRDKDQL